MSPFLIFLKFLRSYVLYRSGMRETTRVPSLLYYTILYISVCILYYIYQVLFYLWRIGPALKHCKVAKYYD